MHLSVWMSQHVMPNNRPADEPIELEQAEMGPIGAEGYDQGGNRTLIPWSAIRYVDIFLEPDDD